MSARTLAEQSPSTRHRARVVERERAARTREEQSPSTRDWARAANREQIAGTRAVQSPCTRDRARVVERERSADAFSSLSPFQQRTQQLGEDLRRLEPLQSNRPRCLFPDELHNNHANQGDAGSVRVSGVGMCEHGHVNGLHQRGGGGGSTVRMSTVKVVVEGDRKQLHFGTAFMRDPVVCRLCCLSLNLT